MLLLLIALNFFSSSFGSITQSKSRIRCSDDRMMFFSDYDEDWLTCSIYCTGNFFYEGCNQCCILEQRSSTQNTFATSTDYRK